MKDTSGVSKGYPTGKTSREDKSADHDGSHPGHKVVVNETGRTNTVPVRTQSGGYRNGISDGRRSGD